MPRGINIVDEAILQNRLWTPSVVRPALWLDANDLSTISVATGISEWRDKSGNGRHVSQATGGTQPTFTRNGLNGLSVLSFNGSQYLTSPASVSTWNFLHNTNGSSVFAVWKAGNVSDPNTFYALLGTNGAASANIGYALAYEDRVTSSRNNTAFALVSRGVGGQSAVVNLTADGVHPANTPVIISHVADPNNGTAANRSFIRVNNGAAIQQNTSTLAPSASNASFALQIGASGNNRDPMVGYIAEIVVFSSIVNDRVRQQVEGYLAHKWGLRTSLVASHPFCNRPPLIGD
jgi:hypothetical protein